MKSWVDWNLVQGNNEHSITLAVIGTVECVKKTHRKDAMTRRKLASA